MDSSSSDDVKGVEALARARADVLTQIEKRVVGQRDVVAEVPRVAVVGVDVVDGLRRAHPLQCRPAAGTDGRDGGPPGATTENDDLRFAVIRCHGDKRSAMAP